MTLVVIPLREDYWSTFEITDEDVEFLYAFLLEREEPQTPGQLTHALVKDRLAREQKAAAKQRSAAGEVYIPKEAHSAGDRLTFPALGWKTGMVTARRPANTFMPNGFQVITVVFEDGSAMEFASECEDHILNEPVVVSQDDPLLSPDAIVEQHGVSLAEKLVAALRSNDDFVYIAGRWFPRALLVDVNVGNLNLAEAVLDMAGGGPLPTAELLPQIDLPNPDNERLTEFSLDLALQEDGRFDEVGSTGKVLWFLNRLEPAEVLKPPLTLRYQEFQYDRSLLSAQMLELEQQLDDEHSPAPEHMEMPGDEAEIILIYPHWRAGTLPIAPRLRRFFPSAYESPRILFSFIDEGSGEEFRAWVVRLEKYVFGLREWYLKHGVMPGSILKLKKTGNPGQVAITTEAHRSTKEWVRTALVGADGGVVYATLKQQVATAFDDRMMVYMTSEVEALDRAWEQRAKAEPTFEKAVVDTLRELAKLNPQAHVHVAELYSALNVITRCPPGPLMARLTSQAGFVHVGDLHFRLDEAGGGGER
ncbi:MAG: hypothetical protein HYZ26_06695 [Chloroflexi bacterium]|nr:hypothetical protein [Chloroflexota bacterium]